MWVVVYRPTGSDRAEQRSAVLQTREQAAAKAAGLGACYDVLRIELVGFQVGHTYERWRDGLTAEVIQTDISGQSGCVRLETGEEKWITWTDAVRDWRLYECCPNCRGTGQLAVVYPVIRDHSKRQNPPTCPTCKGAGRAYPLPGITG
jgi:hypothetical protein